MAAYNTGLMPGTDLRYEDFEGFLASYALTLRSLEKGDRVPVRVKKWLSRENRNKTIAESVTEWRSWQV